MQGSLVKAVECGGPCGVEGWYFGAGNRGLEKHLGCQCESREFVGFSCGKGRVGALKRALLSAGGLL